MKDIDSIFLNFLLYKLGKVNAKCSVYDILSYTEISQLNELGIETEEQSFYYGDLYPLTAEQLIEELQYFV